MPHYYAICSQDDRELTESTLETYFVDEKDTLCDGLFSGPMGYNEIALGFYVTSKDTFDQIAERLVPEGIGFLDHAGVILSAEQYD